MSTVTPHSNSLIFLLWNGYIDLVPFMSLSLCRFCFCLSWFCLFTGFIWVTSPRWISQSFSTHFWSHFRPPPSSILGLAQICADSHSLVLKCTYLKWQITCRSEIWLVLDTSPDTSQILVHFLNSQFLTSFHTDTVCISVVIGQWILC